MTSYQTFDGGRAARVAFDKTPATPLGEGGDATEATKDVIAAATVAYCHESLGAMDTALKLTTDYLTTRKQFGVTLNRFQSLTFRAADMYTSLELTRSIVTWATMVLADESSSAEKKREAASRAKLQVSRAGRHVGQEAIQLHGGIGDDRGVHRRPPDRPADCDRPPARRRSPAGAQPLAPADVVRRGRAAALTAQQTGADFSLRPDSVIIGLFFPDY